MWVGLSAQAEPMFSVPVGVDKLSEGSVWLEGQAVHFRGPCDALRAGVVLVPEDRRGSGSLPNRTVGQNLLLGYEQLPRADRPPGSPGALAAEQVNLLQIRPPRLDRAIRTEWGEPAKDHGRSVASLPSPGAAAG